MQGTNGDPTTATLDFPRPYGVQHAEAARLVQAFEIAEPTLRESHDLTWYVTSLIAPQRLGDLTISQLAHVAAEAQRLLRAETARGDLMRREEVTRFWRTMRGATLLLASKSVQRFGGPFHA